MHILGSDELHEYFSSCDYQRFEYLPNIKNQLVLPVFYSYYIIEQLTEQSQKVYYINSETETLSCGYLNEMLIALDSLCFLSSKRT